MSDGQPELRLELYVRSLLPRGGCEHQEVVLDRLQRLDEDDVVDAFEVSVWGRGIGPSTATETDAGRELQRLVETFSEWARDQGLTLRPRFEPRSVCSQITGEEYDAISFPSMALAAFQDEDVLFVAPCADGTKTYTVENVLEAFEVASENDPDRIDLEGLTVEGSERTVQLASGSQR